MIICRVKVKNVMGHVEEKVEIILSPQRTYIVSSTINGITDIIP